MIGVTMGGNVVRMLSSLTSGTVDPNTEGQILDSWWDKVSANMPDFFIHLGISILILIVGTRLVKFLLKKTKQQLQKRNVPAASLQILDSLVRVFLYVLIAVIIAEIMEIPLNSVFYLLGTVAVALALAVKDYVATIASGVVILFLHPYVLGDYIITSTGVEGTVKNIGLFYTTLLTYDNQTVAVPNNQITANHLTNVTKEPIRMVELKIGISYDSDLKKAKDIFLKILNNVKGLMPEHPVTVVVSELADSSVVLQGRCYVPTHEYWPTKWMLLEQVKLAYDEAGIVIPFPQVSVHMEEVDEQQNQGN